MTENEFPTDEFASFAERDLYSKLELVRSEPVEPGAELVRRVARTLRWQQMLKIPLAFVSSVAGGILGAIRAMSAPRRES